MIYTTFQTADHSSDTAQHKECLYALYKKSKL